MQAGLGFRVWGLEFGVGSLMKFAGEFWVSMSSQGFFGVWDAGALEGV